MDVDELASSFLDVRAVVLGDLMLDWYAWGTTSRISPEAPVPILCVHERSSRPGGAANTAANLAALGARVALAGVIGNDADGHTLRAELEALGIDQHGVLTDDHRPTTTKTRFYAHGQQLLRADIETAAPLPAELRLRVTEHALALLRQADVVVLSDYGKGVVSAELARALIDRAREAGRPILVDPKGRDFTKYRHATVVTPNIEELSAAVNTDCLTDAEVEAGARSLVGSLGARTAVLVTRGPAGMTLLDTTGCHHLPTVARDVFDVTGAGDTVLAVLALAVTAGAPLRDAAELANRAAAIVVARLGTAAINTRELIAGARAPHGSGAPPSEE